MTSKFSPVTAPAARYFDPAYWSREREGVFARTWQFAAHVSDLPEPGCWRAEILAGYPIVIVRDEGGAVRAFHNVCRHRAGPLTDGDSGKCDGALTCKYHGWRYALDGRLRSARDFGPADDFDIRDYSLFPVRVEQWRGLIFVAMSDEIMSLRTLLAPLDARLGSTDWSGMHVALRRSHELQCNWKTYVENYLEGYHVPTMHPGLDAEIVSAEYKVHVEGHIAIHEAPMRDPNPVYDGLWAWAWPNLGFNVYTRGMMIERMAPCGPGVTRLEYVYLMPAGETVGPETLALSDTVTAEDKWITERVQQNLDAGVYRTGRLSAKHEGAVAAFQAMVEQAVGTL